MNRSEPDPQKDPNENNNQETGEREAWYKNPLLTHPILTTLYGLLLAALFAWIGKAISDHFNPPESLERKVSRLSTGMTNNAFRDVLGKDPTIDRPINKKWRETLWMSDARYAVQTISTSDGQVLGFSVTTRSKDFKPDIPVWGHKLGSVHFNEVLPNDGSLVMTSVAAANGTWWYSEALQGGGATHGRTYVMSNSWAGFRGEQHPRADTLDLISAVDRANENCSLQFCAYNTKDPSLTKLRKALTVTTYSVLGPDLTVQDLPYTFQFGPTRDDSEATFTG